MSQAEGESCSNFNYPIGGVGGGGVERRMKQNKKREGRGVVTKTREKLYQSDQSSVLLQSPDKAGTAGGETMCIKTS